MKIQSKFKMYDVELVQGFSFLEELLNAGDSFFVVDQTLFGLYPKVFGGIPKERCFLLEALEEHKIVDTALKICERMTEIPAKRNVRLVSFGGGIVQDVTGFVANILYRGIAWTFVPTTLLAACDSCIGGKTSLNYKQYKNLLGTFYPPDRIIICSDFLHTLSELDFKSGLGEVVKFNIMAGEEGLRDMERNLGGLLQRDPGLLNRFVESSLQFKKTFIEADEFDRGERIKLNFAHTFGHAIESVTQYGIPHGTAVAIGMVMANSVSVKRGLLEPDFAARAEKVLLKIISIAPQCPRICRAIESRLIEAIRKDKKQTSDQLTAVLMTNTAQDLKIVHDLSTEEILMALGHFEKAYY